MNRWPLGKNLSNVTPWGPAYLGRPRRTPSLSGGAFFVGTKGVAPGRRILNYSVREQERPWRATGATLRRGLRGPSDTQYSPSQPVTSSPAAYAPKPSQCASPRPSSQVHR